MKATRRVFGFPTPMPNSSAILLLRPLRAQKGMALVLVLGFVVLITVLVVAFFTGVSTELSGAKASASALSARQLATSAVQMVQGTISDATEPRKTTNLAWACQPGMIRTYGSGDQQSDAPSSTPFKYYKLYSSDNMVVSKESATPIGSWTPESDLAADWNNKPAMWADLNTPIPDPADPAGHIFPIVDPRAYTGNASTDVAGFAYDKKTPSGANQITVSGVKTGGGDDSLLPMPVKWIYVLRDGSVTAPSSADATTATFSGTGTPTTANPIVGRIAFWTDDESGKININTASEGTYWDTPVANAGNLGTPFAPRSSASPPPLPGDVNQVGDVTLAQYQGAQHEYQRYPGHPATTCLSTVFGSVLNGLSREQIVQAITAAIPRVTDDPFQSSGAAASSSMGGTKVPTADSTLVPDIDRLFADPNDFAFTPSRDPQQLGGIVSEDGVRSIVKRSQFFLTASSKAPELNLFGLPRVAMWPVWSDANQTKRTAFDRAILRCATVANGAGSPHPMIFQRADPKSSIDDFNLIRNQEVYGYLKRLLGRPIPGFGGNFLAKYGLLDQSQFLTEIFDYIRSTNLADQSETGRDPAIKSYTPSIPPGGTNLNVAVGQVVPTQVNASNQGFGRIATISELALVLVKVDDRVRVGEGESPSNQATQINVFTQAGDLPAKPDGTSASTIYPKKETMLEWALIPKFFSPMAGFAALGNDIKIRFAIKNLKIGDAPPINKPLNDPSLAELFDTGRLPSGGRDAIMGGLMGCAFLTSGGNQKGAQIKSMFPTGLCVVTGTNKLNFDTPKIGDGTIAVSGDVDVYIYAPNGSKNPLQTLHFNFPTTLASGSTVPNVPIPLVQYWRTNNPGDATGTFRGFGFGRNQDQITFTYGNNSSKGGPRFDASLDHFLHDQLGDTVRSLVPTGTITVAGASVPVNGDMRLIAASPDVPATAWKLSQRNQALGSLRIAGGVDPQKTDFEVSCLRFGPGSRDVGNAQLGSVIPLVNSMKYGSLRDPEIPAGIPAALMRAGEIGEPRQPSPGNPNGQVPGDWDNGPGLMVDGPYINKPDEGQAGTLPYIGPNNLQSYNSITSTFFSPNRQVSSPVMFGSLPVGLDHPWRTLLFRPAKLAGYQLAGSYQHPGGADTSIPDHLLLDLFWMPVVEPYGISEPLATSGKINLNTQIAPFTYIARTTGMRAILKSVMITAIGPNLISSSKLQYGTGTGESINNTQTRYPIDPDQTLNQLTNNGSFHYPVFSRTAHSAAFPNFFVSPSQICDVPLIPVGTTSQNSSLSSFWSGKALTGDNSLERPYSMIYPRVTTKSNVFTVHVRAQSLQKSAGGKPEEWRENLDQVTGEFRGSSTIEKYYDPNEANIMDKGGSVKSNSDDKSLPDDAAVRGTRWRLVNSKQFGQ